MLFPTKLLNLEPYDPSFEVFDVKLDANENAVTVDETLRAKILDALRDVDLNRYPDPGSTALREAAARVYGVTPDRIGVGNGSDEILSILMNGFLARGDAVVMSEFDFSMYAFYAQTAELRAVRVPVDEELRLSADALLEAVRREGARMLILSNPCNPTGQGFSRADVRRLAREAECLVVVDEAYMDFWDQSVIDELDSYENLAILRTCSKAFGLAAVRCGVMVASRELIGYFNRVRSPYNINALTQAAVTTALSEPETLAAMARDCVRRADSLRTLARGLCTAYPDYLAFIPTVTNFALLQPRPNGVWNAAYCLDALRARRIGVRLQKDAYLRITAGTDAENSAVIFAIDEILRNLEG